MPVSSTYLRADPYVRDRDHVAGFRPHQFRRLPDAPKRWQVERLELISLLKHDRPVAYFSNNLPKMDELRDAPTRPLDQGPRIKS
jgi:hypothetical protein